MDMDRDTQASVILESHRREVERLADAGEGASRVVLESFSKVIADLVMMDSEDGFAQLSAPGLMGQSVGDKGLSLVDVKKVTKYLERQTKVHGSILGRGLRLKSNHMTGRGFQFEVDRDAPNRSKDKEKSSNDPAPRFKKIMDREVNLRAVFSATALKELNRILFTSGNLFLRYDKTRNVFQRLSIDVNIDNAIVSKADRSIIEYVLVTYPAKQNSQAEPEREWVPTFVHSEYLQSQGISLPRTLPAGPGKSDPIRVVQDAVIIEKRVNRDNGDTWGVPDSLAAAPYAILYARYLKNSAALQEALSSIAYMVQVASADAGRSAQAQLQQAKIGDALIGGTETKVTPMPSSGRVNLYEGRPIVAAAASALDVSTTGITSDPGLGGSYASESALSQPELLAALSRQEDFADLFRQIFKAIGAPHMRVTFNRLDTDPIHRIVQSLTVALENDGITFEEYRERITGLLDVDKIGGEFYSKRLEKAEKAAARAQRSLSKGKSSAGGFDDDGNSAKNDDKAASEA